MSLTFTKLFSSITESTIWLEPAPTRLVWITMLAMADRNGLVFGSVPGLAHRARVEVEDCRAALRTLLGPDPESRTPDNGGRRIAVIDGGWRLLNHAKYRGIQEAESVRESKRAYMRRKRASGTTDSTSSTVENSPLHLSLQSGSGNPDPDARDGGSRPAVLRTLPEGYAPSEALLAQVAAAGCPRHVFDARLAELRTGPIGGNRGVLPAKLEGYLLSQAVKWKTWHANESVKSGLHASSKSQPAPERRLKTAEELRKELGYD